MSESLERSLKDFETKLDRMRTEMQDKIDAFRSQLDGDEPSKPKLPPVGGPSEPWIPNLRNVALSIEPWEESLYGWIELLSGSIVTVGKELMDAPKEEIDSPAPEDFFEGMFQAMMLVLSYFYDLSPRAAKIIDEQSTFTDELKIVREGLESPWVALLGGYAIEALMEDVQHEN